MAQGVDRAFKFPRSQSDRASVGPAGAGLIHGGPTPQHTTKCPGARHQRTPSEVLNPFLYIYIYIVCALCLRSTRAHHTSLRLGPT